jgi:tripartite-type tricarboxylate transporter receptor subunit TctC
MNAPTRRAALAGLGAVILAPHVARAAWPDRAISMVHGFAPGGGADVTARILGEALAQKLGQPVLVESKPGAGSTLAAAQVARAAPDGHTIMLIGSAYAAAGAMYRKLPYRPVDDFAAIGQLCEFPYLIVTHSDHDIGSFADLVKAARTRDTRLSYGTNGKGSTQHLLIELLARQARIKLQHVPYRGGAQALADVLGKRIDFMLDPPIIFLEHIQAGRLRPLAATGATRFDGLPNVPTVAESGFAGFAVTSWFGLLAPAGVPSEIVSRLNSEVAAALADAAIQEKLRKLGNTPAPSAPAAFRTLIADTIAKWNKVIDEASIERV